MLPILVFWLLSPLPLIVILFVLYGKYEALKRQYKELLQRSERVIEVSEERPVSRPVMEQEKVKIPQEEPAPQVQPWRPIPETSRPEAVPVSSPAKKREEHGRNQKRQAVNATLITGVLLVVAAGLIFATTTWRIIPAALKVILISSLSALFFLTSYFGEKKLKLRLTSIAFYHLGCVFVPVSILSIGYFRLFGPWFSVDGDGRYWLQLSMAVTFGALTYLGYRHYNRPSFYYGSWLASACAVWILSRGVGGDWKVSFLWESLYGTGIATWVILKKGKERLISIHPVFVALCTVQALWLYSPTNDWFIILVCCSMMVFFWVYHFSGRFLPCPFETEVSRWMFPSLAFLGLLSRILNGDRGISLLLLLGIFLCTAPMFFWYENREMKGMTAWTFPLFVGIGFYLFGAFLQEKVPLEVQAIHFALYTVILLALALGKYVLKGRGNSDMLKHPGMALAAFLVLAEMMEFGIEGGRIWMLWELLILCVFLRKNVAYAVGAAILGLFLPSHTLVFLDVYMYHGMYWLIVGIIGACYYKCSYMQAIKGFYKSLLGNWGLAGIYLGVFATAIMLAESRLEPVEILLLLALIVGVDIAFYKTHGNLSYAGINFWLVPAIWGGMQSYVTHNSHQAMTVAAVLGVGLTLLGRRLFPLIWQEIKRKEEDITIKSRRIDYLWICGGIAISYLMFAEYRWWIVTAFLLLAFWFANGYVRLNGKADGFFTGGIVFSIYSAVCPLISWELSIEDAVLLMAVLGLGFCYLSYWKKGAVSSKVLKCCGLLGLYTGGLVSVCLLCMNEGMSPWFAILLLGIIALGDVLGEIKKDTKHYGMMNLAVIPVVSRLVFLLGGSRAYCIGVGLLAGILMMAGGRLLSPSVYETEGGSETRSPKRDYLGVSAAMGILLVLSLMWGDHIKIWLFVMFLYGIVWSLNWYRRRNITTDHLSVTGSLIMFFGAWMTQPLVDVLPVVKFEYFFAGLFLVGVAAGMVWRDKRRTMNWYYFLLTACFAVPQSLWCMIWAQSFDIIVLGAAMLAALGAAYKKKNLSWLSLSLGTLTALVLYMTKSLWFSIAWWVYLLVAGMSLIGTAAYHEYKKREGKQDGPRWKHQIEEWTWKLMEGGETPSIPRGDSIDK